MSKEDLWSVLGRARADLEFSREVSQDLENAISKAGYQLSPDDLAYARTQLQMPIGPTSPFAAAAQPSKLQLEAQEKTMKMQLEAQEKAMKRVADLWHHVTESIKAALTNAAATYRLVTRMNLAMFGAGVGLFIFAAVYGAVSGRLLYAAVFGGLGTGTFVALFLSGAIDKTQNALSNLVQVDIALSSFLEQVSFWEAYAYRPKAAPFGPPGPPELEQFEKASEGLHKRAVQTIQLLQEYVEIKGDRKGD